MPENDVQSSIQRIIVKSNKAVSVVYAGPRGPIGPAGDGVGIPGPEGPQGPAGPQGAAGPTGPTGATGPTGPQGPIGPTGETGAPGETGATGLQGPEGPQGPQGVPGADGAQGPQGPQGIQGIEGPAGPAGPAGLTWKGEWDVNTIYNEDDHVTHEGSSWFALRGTIGDEPGVSPDDWHALALQGTQGAQGPQGVQGVQGDPGPTGPEGPEGPVGATGAQGPAGADGATGATGAQGPQGIQGEAGPTGATGPQGEIGPQGPKGATWRGAWSAGTAYVIDDVVSRLGSSYIAIATTTNEPPESTPSKWEPVAVKGDTGDTGATGAQGPAGVSTNQVPWTIDGSGVAIAVGQKKAVWRVPFPLTLTGWFLYADPSATLSLDLYRDTHANYPPTSSDSLVGTGTKPATTAANKNSSNNLANWADVTLETGDLVDIAVISNDLATRIQFFLTFTPI